MHTLLEDFRDKEVVVLAGRYIWAGTMGVYTEPLFRLHDARQVVNHDWNREIEANPCGKILLVSLASVEAIYLAEEMQWSRESKYRSAGKRK